MRVQKLCAAPTNGLLVRLPAHLHTNQRFASSHLIRWRCVRLSRALSVLAAAPRLSASGPLRCSVQLCLDACCAPNRRQTRCQRDLRISSSTSRRAPPRAQARAVQAALARARAAAVQLLRALRAAAAALPRAAAPRVAVRAPRAAAPHAAVAQRARRVRRARARRVQRAAPTAAPAQAAAAAAAAAVAAAAVATAAAAAAAMAAGALRA